MAWESGLKPPLKDPFQSMMVRVLEIVHALKEVAGEGMEYEQPVHPSVPCKPKAGVCHGISEAPRGTLYHSCGVNPRGQIERAKIVPPTAQDQSRMEDDIRLLVPQIMESDVDRARRLGEMAIRNYDPCISCATHFLRLDIKRALG